MSMATKPNIVFIMTDQQRGDTLGCNGSDPHWTPHLDALARRGVNLSRAFVQSTVCGPSRACVVTGLYVHEHGAGNNGTWPAADAPNWIATLRDGGYHTVNIGKMHTDPIRLPCGFEYRWIMENKNHDHGYHDPQGGADDYDLLLAEHGFTRPGINYHETLPDWRDRLGATIWPLADELYPDNVIGQRCVDWIAAESFERPLFLWAGFPGPHDPFDVPQSDFDACADWPVPPPVALPGELETKPPRQKTSMEKMDGNEICAAIWWSRATPERIARMRRHYWTNVHVIDRWVGRLVAALDQRGQLDNTIFIFTSDHGDCLGDHHQVYKFSTHYEPVVRVPLVMAGPGIPRQDANREDLVELIDLGPTVLGLAGLRPDPRQHGRDLLPRLRGEAADWRDAVFSVYGQRRMIRTARWKLVDYGDGTGELYDLEADPDELRNHWDDADTRAIRAALAARLADHLATPAPG